MIVRIGWSLGLFLGSLMAGWVLGRLRVLTEGRARHLIRVVVKVISPLILALTFWRLDLTHRQTLALPFVGFIVSAATLVPAWGYSRWAKLTRPQLGSFLNCAFFSNLGYLGAFVAFAVGGETAYGLAMLYLVYFSPCFYLLGFSLAKRFGHPREGAPPQETAWGDELRLYPFLGLLAGVACSVLRVPRPAVCEPLNHILIPLDTALYVTAIGSQLRFEWPGRWWPAGLAMGGIKFLFSPLIGWWCVQTFGLQGWPRVVVLLQAAMPVGVSPLMLPALFGVDRKLTNALWLTTTMLAIPWLLLYLPLIR